MDTNSIFITQREINKRNDIAGRITYTNVLETIPDESVESPRENWRGESKTEWRWRFLKFPNDRLTVEISYLPYDEDKRIYFNRHGSWVHRFVDPRYDRFLIKEYYYYTN